MIGLSEDLIFEELVLREHELQDESHAGLFLGEADADVAQRLQDRLVVRLRHLREDLRVLEDGQPEPRDTFLVVVVLLNNY